MLRRRGWSKFHAKKTIVDGIQFDSKLEARRWCELILLQKAGVIQGLARQAPFEMIVNGHLICTYRADFTYQKVIGPNEIEGIVEDVKSEATITPEFRLKAKLMEALHGIVIQIWPPRQRKSRGGSRGRWKRATRQPRSPRTSKRGAGSPVSF